MQRPQVVAQLVGDAPRPAAEVDKGVEVVGGVGVELLRSGGPAAGLDAAALQGEEHQVGRLMEAPGVPLDRAVKMLHTY